MGAKNDGISDKLMDELIDKIRGKTGDGDCVAKTEEVDAILNDINAFKKKVLVSKSLASDTLVFCEKIEESLADLDDVLVKEGEKSNANSHSVMLAIINDMLSRPDIELRPRLDDWHYELSRGQTIDEQMRVCLMVCSNRQSARNGSPQIKLSADKISEILEMPDAIIRGLLEKLLESLLPPKKSEYPNAPR